MNKPWSVPARGKTLRHIGLALLALLSSAHAAGQALPASYAQGASTGYRVENCTALGAAYPWRDIGATGTAVSLGDDHVSGNIPLGFSFGFGGGGYTRLRIGSNGMLFFDAASTAWANAALPLAGLNAVLLPYWDDLNPAGVAGRIRHQTLGAAPNRVFVVSYLAVPHYCSGGSGCSGNQTTGITETFQVQLHETAGEIVFFYRAMSTFGGGWTAGPVPAGGLPEAGATIGIEVNNTDFIQYSFNANSISNGSVLVFSPIASAPRCSSLNHLRIEHAGSGVTCTPTTLTLRACADAACSAPFTGGVSGTLTATGTPTVNWVGGTGFTIPAGSGSVTKNAQVTTAGTVSWSATGL
ncbi:MAG: hypothetical protein KGZ43_11405, partial [Sulfuritalea sp.]|nr:hypothetical protein [Sulfuritalea sp.]